MTINISIILSALTENTICHVDRSIVGRGTNFSEGTGKCTCNNPPKHLMKLETPFLSFPPFRGPTKEFYSKLIWHFGDVLESLQRGFYPRLKPLLQWTPRFMRCLRMLHRAENL